MKRTKLLLSTIVSFLLAFVMVFAVACNNGNNGGNDTNDVDHGITDSSKDNLALDHISVRDYTETFTLGTPFTTGNLVVSATLNDYGVSDKAMSEVELKANEYTVDSSDYNANRVGVYTIYVSYTRANVTRTAHYTVEVVPVVPEYGGIVVEPASGEKVTSTLSTASPSVTIEKSLVSVYMIGANGEKEDEALHEDLYDADLYLGSTKIENNTTDKGGVYSLVVTLKADTTKQDFISVYVINPVTGIALANADSATTSQEAGSKDVISDTWQFTVTYSNGVTKTVKAGDAGLTIDIDTRTAGENKTATVKYVEVDASGSEKEVTTTVTYTITAKEVSGDSVTYVMKYTVNTTDATAKTGSFVTSYDGTAGEDTAGNVTITSTASNFLTREKSTSDNSVTLSDYAEIKEGGNKNVTIVVGAKATNVSVKVYVSHTSSSAPRTAYLASATTTDDASKIVDSKTVGGDGNLSANNLHALEGDLQAGTTYHVFTSGSSDTMHLYQVVVTYTIEGQGGGGDVLPATITVTSDEVTGYPADGTLTSDLAWGNSEILKVLTGCKVNGSKKNVDGVDIQNRLQTAGAAATSGKAIEIDLTGPEYSGLVAHVRVVFYVGSGDTRYLQVLDSSGSEYTAGTKPAANRSTSEQFDETVNLAGGAKYYLGGSNGINIYKVVITFEKA